MCVWLAAFLFQERIKNRVREKREIQVLKWRKKDREKWRERESDRVTERHRERERERHREREGKDKVFKQKWQHKVAGKDMHTNTIKQRQQMNTHFSTQHVIKYICTFNPHTP